MPQEIFNYLQTHLPEKKYDIVLASEKKKYTGNENKSVASKMSVEEFESAVKKLKILIENDLISEEEYKAKKTELLDSI